MFCKTNGRHDQSTKSDSCVCDCVRDCVCEREDTCAESGKLTLQQMSIIDQLIVIMTICVGIVCGQSQC